MKRAIVTVGILAIDLSVFFSLICAPANGASSHGGKKGAPAIHIVSPANGGAYAWNTRVNYEVVASRNGKSTKYDEIPSNRVILKTTYVPDVSATQSGKATGTAAIPAAVVDIAEDNCLGCHAFRSRSTGPSFQAMNRRYADTAANVKRLVQHVRNGSTGVWGSANMPPHPDLDDAELTTIVRWILRRPSRPDVDYYVGAQGTFRMNAPRRPSRKAGLMLTAGFATPDPEQRHHLVVHARDTIVLRGKPSQ